MQPEENPLIEKALNKNINSFDEIQKIDNELNECRLKLLSSNVRGEALDVVKRRINDLLDKRLIWMEQPKSCKKEINSSAKVAPKNNKKRIMRLMRRKLR